MKKLLITSALTLSMLLTVGCSSRGYSQSSVNQAMTVKPGVVTSVRQVEINNDGVGNGLGTVLGAAAGAAAANSRIGGGTGKVIATGVGAVAGGVVGGMIGDNMDARYGVEVVVKLNSGGTVATVLPANGALARLAPGQAVNVIYSAGRIESISPQ